MTVVCQCGHRCEESEIEVPLQLSVLIGRNARGIRMASGITLETFAQAMTQLGFPWTSGRVGDLESGRVSPTLPTLYGVTQAFSALTGRSINLLDLLSGDARQMIALNKNLSVCLELLWVG